MCLDAPVADLLKLMPIEDVFQFAQPPHLQRPLGVTSSPEFALLDHLLNAPRVPGLITLHTNVSRFATQAQVTMAIMQPGCV